MDSGVVIIIGLLVVIAFQLWTISDRILKIAKHLGAEKKPFLDGVTEEQIKRK